MFEIKFQRLEQKNQIQISYCTKWAAKVWKVLAIRHNQRCDKPEERTDTKAKDLKLYILHTIVNLLRLERKKSRSGRFTSTLCSIITAQSHRADLLQHADCAAFSDTFLKSHTVGWSLCCMTANRHKSKMLKSKLSIKHGWKHYRRANVRRNST